jgi:hypothetical protein
VQEIRTLRAMWRALETEPRQILNGHEEGNLGHKPRTSLRAAAPALDPTSLRGPLSFNYCEVSLTHSHYGGILISGR